MRPIAALLCLLTVACGADDETPTPPDMSALVHAYEAPDGELTAETAPLLIAAFIARGEELAAAAGLIKVVTNVAAALGGGGESGSTAEKSLGVRRDALSLRSSGWARASYICDGWATPAEIDRKWGVVEMLTVFREADPAQILWGHLDACKILVDGQKQALDGAVRAWIPKNDKEERFLVEFIGSTLNAAGEAQPVHMDLMGGKLAAFGGGSGGVTLQAVEGHGGFLVGGVDGQDSILVIAHNGAWSCLLGPGGQSGSCEGGPPGAPTGERFQW